MNRDNADADFHVAWDPVDHNWDSSDSENERNQRQAIHQQHLNERGMPLNGRRQPLENRPWRLELPPLNRLGNQRDQRRKVRKPRYTEEMRTAIDLIRKQIARGTLDIRNKEVVQLKLQACADACSVDVDGLTYEVAGLVRPDFISSLTVSQEIKNQIEAVFKLKFAGPIETRNYYFKFTTNTIEHKNIDGDIFPAFEIPRVKFDAYIRMLNALRRIYCVRPGMAYLSRLNMYPSTDNYELLLGDFRAAANHINQGLGKIITLPERIVPRQPKITRKFQLGFVIDPRIEGQHVDFEDMAEPWMQEFRRILEQRGSDGVCEFLKAQRPDLYNKMTKYHKSVIKLHNYITVEDEKVIVSSHGWSNTDLKGLARIFLSSLTKHGLGGLVTHDNEMSFRSRCTQFTSFANVRLTPEAKELKIGNICIACPCMDDTLMPCQRLFNVSDKSTKDSMISMFDGFTSRFDPEEPICPVEQFIIRVNQLTSHNGLMDMRTHPVCPMCGEISINEAAIHNFHGMTPIDIHPSDMKCKLCDHNFCTDCKGTHKGKICNGLPPGNDAINTQATPCCGQLVSRIDGCAFMVCKICNVNWCWKCRVKRKGEYSVGADAHYCITPDGYQSNPAWRDGNVTIYEHNMPHGEWDMANFVPP